MRVRISKIGIVLCVVLASPLAVAGGPGPQTSPSALHRLGPAGGWNPDGRGLFHWWDAHCFSAPCTVDDYCRKPLPRLHCPPRPIRVDPTHRHASLCSCPACLRAQ
ncbi:hypothetical protein SAMN05444166_0563 [Singulisphaera sp. GP187]|nr:hypothetical protein SAMN05444166_0563 [Singulisphaera sp. GP187]